jgi:hypothetical protein
MFFGSAFSFLIFIFYDSLRSLAKHLSDFINHLNCKKCKQTSLAIRELVATENSKKPASNIGQAN